MEMTITPAEPVFSETEINVIYAPVSAQILHPEMQGLQLPEVIVITYKVTIYLL